MSDPKATTEARRILDALAVRAEAEGSCQEDADHKGAAGGCFVCHVWLEVTEAIEALDAIDSDVSDVVDAVRELVA